MSIEQIEIKTPDGVVEAYVGRPEEEGEYPGVIFYIDAIGLRPRIAEMVERIASWGYIVLAPNQLYRAGTVAELAPKADLSNMANIPEFFGFILPIIDEHTADQARIDADAYIDTLLALPGVRGRKIGTTGYCWGGRLALRAAGSRPDEVVAVGMFHTGDAVTDADDSPHRVIGNVRAELFIGHADNDPFNTPESIAVMEKTLDEAGLTYTSEVFEGAMHGYTMSDSAAVYNEAAAERHFRELEALFGRTLQAQ
ncbi:dienelactone hydrolase family protein [Nocardia sp. NBC_00565]|uniref:dienelactone hydrolase family protein n=1 Tax=Nocardia sp. NBC_00565 TaxID=2975993 RepID=UPI002E8027BD|nr:dienelactone hydrolase family protein [Nocardia sp. NBC_00565]WUC06596.1 dienelactone hydrolase family protein [Nocardia sp. NBC_00565]